MKKWLEELFDKYWKGIFPYEDLSMDDKRRFKKEYTAEEFYEALRAAYNLGIEIAAVNAKTTKSLDVVYDEWVTYVNKDSILKFKIEDE